MGNPGKVFTSRIKLHGRGDYGVTCAGIEKPLVIV